MISVSSSTPSSSSNGADARKKPRCDPKIPAPIKWRTVAQERLYGRRLLESLPAAGSGAGAVKAAADSALALTARGQSRWSRAILFSRCRRRKVLLKAGGCIRRRRRPRPGGKLAADPVASKDKKVRERLRVLARLVPGCRKLPATSLLEETADYLAALEMQVKAMRALADALSAATIAAAPPSEN
ncbi:transcription factor bHLH149-like [Typha angustifolia]|uniref:transcription factor bHLH149-like n=1 Tax=Typha angustifolia TaxID=59011 RepID=UPI003C2E66A8